MRQEFRLNTADFLGTRMMVVVLKQVGILSCDSDVDDDVKNVCDIINQLIEWRI